MYQYMYHAWYTPAYVSTACLLSTLQAVYQWRTVSSNPRSRGEAVCVTTMVTTDPFMAAHHWGVHTSGVGSSGPPVIRGAHSTSVPTRSNS